MSNVLFTIEQQKAIDAREQEILVAAAAGSGKTAVLVERIITLILTEHVAITQLVILTFTNAAASQMKTRIRNRLQTLMEHVSEEEKAFLQKQILLLPVAHISTFHAYCMTILRDHYQFANISPNFKIIEENALSLLKEEALAMTIEQMLQNQEEHRVLLDYFVIGNKLHRLEAIISEIYDKTRSYAFVDRWMQQAVAYMEDEEMVDKLIEAYIDDYYQQLNVWLRQFKQIENALVGFPKNQEAIMQISVAFKQFSMIPYESSIAQLRVLQFPKWSAIKTADVTAESTKAYELFNKLKKEITHYAAQNATPQEIASEQDALGPIVKQLFNVVRLYEQHLTKLKDEKDVIDFSDVEHKMITLLRENDALRQEISQNITEILVDEYQDTNEVQDTILQLLRTSVNRLFMVGDIKQSIYRFRLADPTIFLTKKQQYEHATASQKLIVLNKNFRSGYNILTTVNTVFTLLFKLDIHYPAEEQLYLGSTENQNDRSHYTKWHFFADQSDSDAIQIQTLAEKKAMSIVNEVIRLVEEEEILDEATQAYRPVCLEDIAILFRSRGSQLITYIEQKLEEAQIHFTSERDTGYFDAVEVNVVLALLNSLENPYDSIALLAYLRSPICLVTDEELFMIADYYRSSSMTQTDKFYTYVTHYIANQPDELATRLKEILEQMTKFRNKLAVMKLSEALEIIYQETNYYNFVATLPNGNIRRANLDILVHLARKQEVLGKNNLALFNKYMRNLQKNQRDFSLAKPKGESSDTLHLMTIHKSKGLEFPIVFLVDLDKPFNEQEIRSNYQLSKTYGLALQYHDVQKHIRYKTQHYQLIARQTAFNAKAEELRVLYVALTRPMRQLHLFLDESEEIKPIETTADILDLRSYGEALRAVYQRMQSEATSWQVEQHLLKGIIVSKQLSPRAPLDASKGTAGSTLTQDEIEHVQKQLKKHYKYHNFENYTQKHTVTELKQRLTLREMQPVNVANGFFEKKSQISKKLYEEMPQFMRGHTLTALEQGTLYHLVLQQYPWSEMPTLQAHLKRLVQQKIITESEKEQLQPEKIYKAVRNIQADYLAKGYEIVGQELPFSFKYDAKIIYNEPLFTDETLLIQGKIDMLLRKDKSFVVIDFKTDKLRENETAITLEQRYENQLFFYREAVRQVYQTKEVKTKIYPIFG